MPKTMLAVVKPEAAPGADVRQMPLPEIGPDDVLVEIHQVIRLRRALGSVDVEVILPEIGHHFLKLPLAGDRASNSRRL